MRTVKFVAVVGLVGALTIVPGGGAWPPNLGLPGLGWAQDVRKRAEDLAKGATERFDELVGGKGKNGQDGSASGGRPNDSLAEQVYAWVSGSGRHYQDLVRRMAEPVRLNPVEDAARRMAAAQRRVGTTGADADVSRPMVVADTGLIEQGVGWVHRSSRDYQEMMRRLSVPAEPSGVIGASKPAPDKAAEDARRSTEAKKAEDEARRVAEAKKAEEAKRAEEARRVAEAKKAVDAKKAEDDARRVAEAKKAEEAKQAEEVRRTAEAKTAADAKKAEDDARRVAEAKKAEEAKQAEEVRRAAAAKKAEDDARRVAEAKKAEEAKQAEVVRKAAEAKKAEDDARRVAEAKKVEEAKQAEEARRAAEAKRVADAKMAEDDARRVAQAKKAEDDARRMAETKKVEEAKPAAAKQIREGQRAMPSGNAAPARKASETKGARKAREERLAGAKRKKRVARMAAEERRRYAWREPRGDRRSKAQRARDCRFAGSNAALPGWYVVRKGDTLWKIASRHYHKGRLYRLIYEANTGRIDHPTRIYPCQRLYIPRVNWRRR